MTAYTAVDGIAGWTGRRENLIAGLAFVAAFQMRSRRADSHLGQSNPQTAQQQAVYKHAVLPRSAIVQLGVAILGESI